ncbi:AcrR family transcriptional regulator [Nakamurella sp. UYEF19]|uniref:TetR/AcrR family transcriptional regulator n=1 Tax=Nakamurella sp. UYEF19 TaxID=1756392 RepID=UPI0033931021
MTQVVHAGRARVTRRQIDKFAERRDQLADSALLTLSELGYARTSLREIAQNSNFSHGVLHYYFSDKVELILHCVRRYKTECVTRYDEIVACAATPGELAAGFGEAMAATLRNEAHLHRLWYDMRSQSLFEPSFRTDILELDHGLEQMIWRIVLRYSELAGRPLAVSRSIAYAVFDGLFQQGLLKHLCGDEQAVQDLASSVENVLLGLVLVPR